MKKMFIELDELNRVTGIGSSPTAPEAIEIEVDEAHDILSDPMAYKIADGVLIRMSNSEIDAIFNKPAPATAEERISQLEDVILMMMLS